MPIFSPLCRQMFWLFTTFLLEVSSRADLGNTRTNSIKVCPLQLSIDLANRSGSTGLECELMKTLTNCSRLSVLSTQWYCDNGYSSTDQTAIPILKVLDNNTVVTCQCIVRTGHGTASRIFTIHPSSSINPIITHHDLEPILPDTFTWLPAMASISNNNLPRYLGRDASFHCLFYVQSTWLRPLVSWCFYPAFFENKNRSFLLNTTLPNSRSPSRYNMLVQQDVCFPWPVDALCYNATLTISGLIDADHGRYRCVVQPNTPSSPASHNSQCFNASGNHLEAEFGLLPVANPVDAFVIPGYSDFDYHEGRDMGLPPGAHALSFAPPFQLDFTSNTSICFGENITLYCSTSNPMVGVRLYLFLLDPRVNLSIPELKLFNSTLLAETTGDDYDGDVIQSISHTVVATEENGSTSDFLCLGDLFGAKLLRWQHMRLTIHRCYPQEKTDPPWPIANSKLLLFLTVGSATLVCLIAATCCCRLLFRFRNRKKRSKKLIQSTEMAANSIRQSRKKVQIFRRTNPLYTNQTHCQVLSNAFGVDLLTTEPKLAQPTLPSCSRASTGCVDSPANENLLLRRQRARLHLGLEPPQLPGKLSNLHVMTCGNSPVLLPGGENLAGDSGIVGSNDSNGNTKNMPLPSIGMKTISPTFNSFGWPILTKVTRNKAKHVSNFDNKHTKDHQQDTISVCCYPVDPVEYEIPIDPEWELPRNCLQLGSKLGEGAFGVVFYGRVCPQLIPEALRSRFPCRKEDNLLEVGDFTYPVAVKQLRVHFTDQELLDFIKETEMMKVLGEHCHLIRLFGACTQVGGPLQVVVEYAAYGNLRDFLRARRRPRTPQELATWAHLPHARLTRLDLVDFGLQVARGMDYLASKSVVHRDLAARNILIGNQFIAKIADFGLTRAVSDYYKKTTSGRLPIRWMSPESLFDRKYTTKSDVWSYGVLLWEIYTLGGVPYPAVSTDGLVNVLREGHRNERPMLASPEVYTLMLQCWQEAADSRPDFSQLVKQIEHLWYDSDANWLQPINLPSLSDTNSQNFCWDTSIYGNSSPTRHDNSPDSGMSEVKDGEEQSTAMKVHMHYLAMMEQYLSPRS